MSGQTIYQAAGGMPAMTRLAGAWHSRVLADPIASHPFVSHGIQPDHVARLASYFAETLGGPADYTKRYADQSAVVRLHSGNGDSPEVDEVTEAGIACFDRALEDAGLAGDPRLRDALHDYFAWMAYAGLGSYRRSAADVPDGLRVPCWGWDGLLN